MTITTNWKTALIVFLLACLILIGVYHYRDHRIELQAVKIQNTQIILNQLNFPANVAQAFRRVGWQVREARPVQAPAPEVEDETK